MQLPIVKIGRNDSKRDPERNVNPKNKRELARNVNPKNKREQENKRVQARNEVERKGNRQAMVYGQESRKYLNERI